MGSTFDSYRRAYLRLRSKKTRNTFCSNKQKIIMKLYALILVLFVSGACRTPLFKDKNAEQKQEDNSLTNNTQRPPSPAHVRGEILSNPALDNESNCAWFLKLDQDSINLLDPVNLNEDFQQNGIKVWVHYSGMRRMNRCPEASPVWVQDMVLRL